MNLLPPHVNSDAKPQVHPWVAVNAIYLKGLMASLQHASVCPEAKVTMQARADKKNRQVQFRLACQCGASMNLPQHPVWAEAWELASKPEIILPQ
jgi:hypothetical protein